MTIQQFHQSLAQFEKSTEIEAFDRIRCEFTGFAGDETDNVWDIWADS